MPANTVRIAPAQRRRAFGLGYLNGVLWAVGNGLTTGTLVTYLAIDLGARGLGLSLILAAPTLVGLLRMLAPPLIARLGSAKRATLIFSLFSYVLIWGLPAVGVPGLVAQQWRLAALVGLVSVHQLLEYMGQVALWSWLADIVPQRLRGRYFGRRQILQLLALTPTLLLAGWFSDAWRQQYASSPEKMLLGYAIPNAVGAALLLLSLVPLAAMPATQLALRRGQGVTFSALRDERFRRLLAYGCWLSFFNGVTQAPQNMFPKVVLGLGVQAVSAMRIGMQVGQMAFSAWAGAFSDRYGNRPTLIVSQLLLATAPGFMLLATPGEPWWLAGAWLAWSAYAGLNICLPNLMLKLAPREEAAAYIATYFAVTSVFYAASTVAGGYVFDLLGHLPSDSWWARFDRYGLAFGMALVARLSAVLLLLRIAEPGAWRWRDILGKRPRDEKRSLAGSNE